MSGEVSRAASKASEHPVVEWGARAGYGANGLLHLIIGWLAAQIAFGSSQKADQSGALGTLAREPSGQALLWVVAFGFILLAAWQVTQIFTQAETSERLKSVGKSVAYAAISWSAFKFASGGRSSSSEQTQDFTQALMEWPGGPFLVGLVGLAIIGIGAYHVYKGITKKFLEDLQEHPGSWAIHAGRMGYASKGVALIAVGILFVIAGVKHKAAQATGLDGGLRTLRDLPAGQIVLLVIAIGIALFGVYCFARARFARI